MCPLISRYVKFYHIYYDTRWCIIAWMYRTVKRAQHVYATINKFNLSRKHFMFMLFSKIVSFQFLVWFSLVKISTIHICVCINTLATWIPWIYTFSIYLSSCRTWVWRFRFIYISHGFIDFETEQCQNIDAENRNETCALKTPYKRYIAYR